MSTTRLALASLVLALCAGGARAQEGVLEGHAPLAEASWGKLTEQNVGQKYYVVGRWESCWGNQITLHKSAVRGFFIANEAIRLPLTTNRIPDVPGAPGKLEDKRSRVRMFGHVEKQAAGIVLVIDRVVKLEDDAVRLKAAAQAAGSDAAKVGVVTREIEALAQKYDDAELRALFSEIKQRELAVRRDALSDDDYRGYAELAGEYARLQERPTAIAMYAHVAAKAEGELRDFALGRLTALGAVQTSKGWSTYEAYKTAEGFIERKDRDGSTRWLRKEEAEFEDVRLAEQASRAGAIVVYRQNPVQHGNNAQAGKLERGQTIEEARAAAGQPVAVFHVRAPDSTAADARSAVWTQWIWADGRRAYFLGTDTEHVAFVVKQTKDEWPKK